MDVISSSQILPQLKSFPRSNYSHSNHQTLLSCTRFTCLMPKCIRSYKGECVSEVSSQKTSILLFCGLINKMSSMFVGLGLNGSNSGNNLVGKICSSAGSCTYPESSIESHSHIAAGKIGVLLLNLGGPDTLQDVQPFLFNLFADPDIIRLPRWFRFLQRPLAQLISVVRAPKSQEGYAAIGGGSPLRKITDEQAKAFKMELEAKEVPVDVYVAMRYWHPYTEEAIQQIKRDGISKLVVLPLYPQYSIPTTGSSIRVLEQKFREDILSRLPVSIIQSWYQEKVMSSLWLT